MKAELLCIEIIKNMIIREQRDLTSWGGFAEANAKGIISKTIPDWRVFKALAYGKRAGYFKAEWAGVGMTPWAGSARRQRMYWLTDKALSEFALKEEAEEK